MYCCGTASKGNLCVHRTLEEDGRDIVFKAIMTENFPILLPDTKT
jgi:hypothetical protein